MLCSGLNVVAPPTGEQDVQDVYQRMLQQARQDAEEQPLQSTEDVIVVTMYGDGFTVGDGEFRPRGDPVNDNFLAALSKGRCPKELMKNGKPQDVKLEDRTKESYVPPAYRAFSGQGSALGSAKKVIEITSVVQPTNNVELPDVNEQEKTIRVQIRYPDNQKQVVKFNLKHVVYDIVRVVLSSGRIGTAFVLEDSKRDIIGQDRFDMTIVDAKLANAVVYVSTKI